jgi:hypothetical protein
MDATTMPSISSLVSKLQRDFTQFHFLAGDDFYWSPKDMTVYYIATSPDAASLLHETAHGVLGHTQYAKDVTLLEMERAAWTCASQQLGPTYGVSIDNDTVEDALDTYRDWLHARSTCPNCQAIGVQTGKHHYSCLACHEKWRVNDARICALRRYKIA